MKKSYIERNQISVIGAGRAGQSLAKALSRRGYIIGGLSCKNSKEAKNAVSVIGQGIACKTNEEAVGDSEIIFITTPDDVIGEVVNELKGKEINWQRRIVFHCSGVLSSKLLLPLKEKGAVVASLHPLQSLASPDNAEKALRSIYFSLEGDAEACKVGEVIVKKLGSKVIQINAENKIFYHTAASMASNYLVTLLMLSCKIMEKGSIELKQAEKALLSLMRGTLENVALKGIHQSLTGPIIRGDEKTILLHLKALREMEPDIEKLYRALGLETLKIAANIGHLSPGKIKRMKKILKSEE
jgi:predicted short-subunit dehydrogenase-like oxidoreductase (DUF2520 family)